MPSLGQECQTLSHFRVGSWQSGMTQADSATLFPSLWTFRMASPSCCRTGAGSEWALSARWQICLTLHKCQSKIARQEWLEGATVIFSVCPCVSQFWYVLMQLGSFWYSLMLQGRPWRVELQLSGGFGHMWSLWTWVEIGVGPGRMMSAPILLGHSSMIQGLSGTGLLRQAAKRGAVEFLQHLSLPMSAVGLPGIAGSWAGRPNFILARINEKMGCLGTLSSFVFYNVSTTAAHWFNDLPQLQSAFVTPLLSFLGAPRFPKYTPCLSIGPLVQWSMCQKDSCEDLWLKPGRHHLIGNTPPVRLSQAKFGHYW